MAEKDEGGRADSKLSRFKGGMFLAAVAGTGLLAGFSTTLGMTKKKSPDMFDKLAEFRTEMQQKLPRIPKARTKNRVENLDSLFGIENDTTEAER
ncbi:transmembrane protein 242-like isoform X2 [Branchiostoma floridae]|uniref:Transmembrane protein 242 n=1 Tax=Branchiostoma floridae TaxID=7739 RepID=A0A9J7LP44_BRAFL|nr:transmembrane protein 242-like isoform X2 [Branchiostoma floridae]